jgi:hypothetical protein
MTCGAEASQDANHEHLRCTCLDRSTATPGVLALHTEKLGMSNPSEPWYGCLDRFGNGEDAGSMGGSRTTHRAFLKGSDAQGPLRFPACNATSVTNALHWNTHSLMAPGKRSGRLRSQRASAAAATAHTIERGQCTRYCTNDRQRSIVSRDQSDSSIETSGLKPLLNSEQGSAAFALAPDDA